LLPPEDSYGRAKRQKFIESLIQDTRPRTVLDFGCGTGTQLTRPLAEACPEVSFLGIDADPSTVRWARNQPALANLGFATPDEIAIEQRFDMIIASEVLEHVESPDRLLCQFRNWLADGGHLVVTVPNGYGPFESMALIEALFTLAGVLPALRWFKHVFLGQSRLDHSQAATLASSPHINFFSLDAMRTLISNTGYMILQFKSRTVFCGYVLDWLIRGPFLRWNALLADYLPAWCASDWMFVCAKVPLPPAAASPWRRTRWGRFRRRLSERRCVW